MADSPVYSKETLALKLKRYLRAYEEEVNKHIEEVGGIRKLTPELQTNFKVQGNKAAYSAEPYIHDLRWSWLKKTNKERERGILLLSVEEEIGKKAHLSVCHYWIKTGYRKPKENKMKVTTFDGEGKDYANFTIMYETLAQKFDYIPNDAFMEEIGGVASSTPISARNHLKNRGYEFERIALEGVSQGLWKVTKRPVSEEELKKEMVEDISKTISGWNPDDLKTLLGLVKQNRGE